jgi:hypothetical protein
MRRLACRVCVALLCLVAEGRATERERLRFDPAFVLAQVAARMGVTLAPGAAPPAVLVESATPLARFRAALAPQWGFVPDAFGNAYAVGRNEIFLIDDPAYYARLGRTIDESLAHELAHYVQVTYLNADLGVPSWEQDAIAIQAWFRSVHLSQHSDPRRRAERP